MLNEKCTLINGSRRGLMQKLLTGTWRVGQEGETGLARTGAEK